MAAPLDAQAILQSVAARHGQLGDHHGHLSDQHRQMRDDLAQLAIHPPEAIVPGWAQALQQQMQQMQQESREQMQRMQQELQQQMQQNQLMQQTALQAVTNDLTALRTDVRDLAMTQRLE